jgi:hypothetical protein
VVSNVQYFKYTSCYGKINDLKKKVKKNYLDKSADFKVVTRQSGIIVLNLKRSDIFVRPFFMLLKTNVLLLQSRVQRCGEKHRARQ